MLLACVGCPSTTVYRTADPVEPGRWQLGAAVGVGALRDTEQETRIPTGHIELSARRGVAENLDLGLKLYTFGAELNGTFRVHRTKTWSFAVLPSFSGLRTNENAITVNAIHLFGQLGGVASRPLSERWNLGLGGFSGWGLYLPVTGGSAQGAWLGAFATADFKMSRRWHLTPELGFYRVVAGEVPIKGSAANVGVAFRLDL